MAGKCYTTGAGSTICEGDPAWSQSRYEKSETEDTGLFGPNVTDEEQQRMFQLMEGQASAQMAEQETEGLRQDYLAAARGVVDAAERSARLAQTRADRAGGQALQAAGVGGMQSGGAKAAVARSAALEGTMAGAAAEDAARTGLAQSRLALELARQETGSGLRDAQAQADTIAEQVAIMRDANASRKQIYSYLQGQFAAMSPTVTNAAGEQVPNPAIERVKALAAGVGK